MKKTIKILLVSFGVIFGIILLDSIQALVFDNNPIIGIETKCMKKEGILVDSYHCGNGKNDVVLKGFSYSCYKDDMVNVSLEDINTYIQDYFSREDVDRNNLNYHYIAEKGDVVVVGLFDNNNSQQEKFIYNVFSNCCGSKYIEYIKNNSMIEFRKSEKTKL